MANKKIKGITIEIGADTLGLDKALKDIEQGSKVAASELREVESAIKKVPESAELWKQKQDLLNNAIEKSNEKVKLLEQAQKSMKDRLRDGDIDQGAYDKFQDKLTKAKDKLGKLKDQEKEFEEKFARKEIDQGAYDKFRKKLEDAENEVKKLETAEHSLEENLKIGNISEEQYRAFKRELETARANSRKLQEQLEDTKDKVVELGSKSSSAANDVDDLGDEAEDTGEQARRAGDGGITAMNVALGNLVYDGIKLALTGLKELSTGAIETGSAFEASMSSVGAISQASEKDVERLSAKAKEMGATTKYTAAESADAFKYMAMAGWKTEDMLNGIDGIMGLAAASGEDLAITSDIVTDALTAMGYGAEEAGHLADVMAAASSNANTNVSLMGETFKYAAPLVGTLGYSMEDTAEQIGLMANAGIKGEMAGTALRSIMTRLAAPTKDVQGAFAHLGIEVEDAMKNSDGSMRTLSETMDFLRKHMSGLDETEQAMIASQIAGKNALSGFLAIINAAPADIEKLSTAIDNCDGAAQNMSTTMLDNLQGDFTILNSAIDGVKISLAEEMTPALRELVQYSTENMPAVEDALIPVAKTAIGTLEFVIKHLPQAIDMAKTAIPVVTAIGVAFTAWKVTQIVDKATTAMTGFSAVLAANPAIAVAAGITMLATAIGLLYVEAETATTIYDDLNAEQQKEYDIIQQNRDAMQELYDTYDAHAGTIVNETERTKDLWEELDSLTSASGRVLDKDKERAQYLLGELNEALGTEYTMTDNQIDGYQRLSQEIDKVIEKKQAEMLLDEFLAMSSEQTKSAMQAKSEYESLDRQRDEAKGKVDAAEAKFREMVGKVVGLDKDISAAEYRRQYGDNATLSEYANDVITANEQYADITTRRNEYRQNYLDAMAYTDKLEEAQKAFTEQRYDDVKTILYANQDTNRQILEDDTSSLEARTTAYHDAIEQVESDFELALASGRQKEIDTVLDAMTETVKLGQKAGVDTSAVFDAEFKANVQEMLDAGFDISKLSKWGKDSGLKVSDIFGDNYTEVIQKQLDEGYDISDLSEWCRRSGLTTGDVFKGKYTEVVQDQLNKGYDVSQLLIWGAQSGENVSAYFSDEFRRKYQEALDSGFDITQMIQWAIDKGLKLGEFFGQSFKDAYTQYIYGANSLINENSINSYSDYLAQHGGLQAIGWDDNLQQAIPHHASGGFVGIGKEAIVAEAGPELLEVMNGGIKVTPLTREAKNTPVSPSGAGKQKLIYNTINVYASVSNDYDVRRLAERIAIEEKQIELSRGLTNE